MPPNDVVSIARSFNTIHLQFQRSVISALQQLASVSVIFLIVTGAGCQSIQKKLTQDSSRCGALCAKAREARELGNADQADQFIDEALRQKPADFDTRRQLAETMWTSGRRAEAVNIYSELYSQQPKNAKLAERLAVMLWEIDQHNKAANLAAIVLQSIPQSKEAGLIKARMEVVEGKLDEGLVSYLQLSQLAEDDFTIATELGQLHLRRGHPDRACLVFHGAMQNSELTAKQKSELEWHLGVAYAGCERWSQALTPLEHGIDRSHASAEDWCLLSRAKLETGDVSGAQENLVRAFTCDPMSNDARRLSERIEMSNVRSIERLVMPAAHSDLR